MKYLSILCILFLSLSTNAQTVYKTPKGEKYHAGDCRFLGTDAESLSVNQAVKIGLDACKVCKPGGSSGLQSAQCKGKTKAGARCKNMTKSSSGYCHHHD